MTRMFSSRATMAAGTRPPRVIATIALNGPSPFRRQASARESRWNWSHDTGNIFSGGGGSAAFLLMLSPDPAVSPQRLRHFVGRRPPELFIQRSRHAGRVQRHEANTAVRPGALDSRNNLSRCSQINSMSPEATGLVVSVT